MPTEHRLIPDAERHEVKGASTATNNQVLTADGDGTTSFRQPTIAGWYNYNHSGATVPLTLASTYYDLINSTAGVNTNITFAIPGATTIWNSGTNRFDFTSLVIGDVLDLRMDIVLTTTNVNTAVDLVLELAVGSGTPVELPVVAQRDIKTAGTYQLTFNIPFFLGSTLIKNNPARLKMRADKTGATVAINGWFISVIRQGDYT
jgi:hypothetical protein